MANTIQVEANKLAPDTYVEFFDFDASILKDKDNNAGPIYYFTNQALNGTAPVAWRGNNYYPFPFEITGIESRGDGTAPGRPQLVLSNANKFLLAAVLSFGNLIGMTVRRWRTFYKYTDAGSEANPAMYFPVDEWVIIKKVAQSKNSLQFDLAIPLDRPGLRLPRAQILRDKGFPGVAKVRMR